MAYSAYGCLWASWVCENSTMFTYPSWPNVLRKMLPSSVGASADAGGA